MPSEHSIIDHMIAWNLQLLASTGVIHINENWNLSENNLKTETKIKLLL